MKADKTAYFKWRKKPVLNPLNTSRKQTRFAISGGVRQTQVVANETQVVANDPARSWAACRPRRSAGTGDENAGVGSHRDR
jgi:hypothetical protein